MSEDGNIFKLQLYGQLRIKPQSLILLQSTVFIPTFSITTKLYTTTWMEQNLNSRWDGSSQILKKKMFVILQITYLVDLITYSGYVLESSNRCYSNKCPRHMSPSVVKKKECPSLPIIILYVGILNSGDSFELRKPKE